MHDITHLNHNIAEKKYIEMKIAEPKFNGGAASKCVLITQFINLKTTGSNLMYEFVI